MTTRTRLHHLEQDRPRLGGLRSFVLIGVAALLVACGGSTTPNGSGGMMGGTDGGSGSGTDGGSAAGTMSGRAIKGAVSGGTMTAFAVSNGSKAQQLGTTTTDAQGNFSLGIGNYSGPVLMEMSGGTYTDEATGTTMSMAAGDVMRAVLPTVAAGASTSGVMVTPLTSMAQARAQEMSGGMTDANISSANGAVGSYFMVSDIVHTMPMDPLVQGSGASATQDGKNYGMVIAGMTQYAHTVGMTSSSGIVTAMMDDASDGVMNGMMGSTSISMSGMGGMMGGGMMMQGNAGTTGLAAGMTQFMTSAMNRSGVTSSDMQPLVEKLNASNGTLQ